MYYILLIIFILFVSLYKRKERFNNIFDDNYFSFFNKKDYKLRKCSSEIDCLNKYNESFIEFTPYEKQMIDQIVKNLVAITDNKYSNIFKNIDIVKVDNSIENSLPHTRGNKIILSQVWIDRAISNFSKNPKDSQIPKLLSHEQFHIFQRFNQEYIDKLYSEYWKMVKLNKKIPDEILELNRTNPDALPDNQWLFKRKNDYILPLCLYREDAKSLTDTENIYIRLDNEFNFIDIVDDLTNRKLLISDEEFTSFFGEEASNNYHPNEISASLFEFIIEDVITERKIKRSPAFNLLKDYLDKN